MVKETQLPYTDLKFPIDGEIGDVHLADNDYNYELMSNLRWRNVIPRSSISPDPDGWEPAIDPDTLEQLYISIPVEGISEGSELAIYPSETIDHLDQLFQMDLHGSTVLPVWSEFYQYTNNLNRVYFVNDWTDTSIPFWSTANDKDSWPSYGTYEISSSANNVPAFNNSYSLGVPFRAIDYINDVSRLSECKVRITWLVSQGQKNTSGNHNFTMAFYKDEKASKNWKGDETNAEFWVTDEWPMPGNDYFPTTERSTGWIDLTEDSNYWWFENAFNAGQRVGGWTIEIDDPTSGGTLENRKFTGFTVDSSGNHVYASRNDIQGTVFEYGLPITDDLDGGIVNHEESHFFDFDGGDVYQETKPLGVHIAQDGIRFFICDDDQDNILETKLRTPFDLSTCAEYDPYNSWDYKSNRFEFVTVAKPLDVQLNAAENMIYVLEADNVIRRYSYDAVYNISWSVYQDEFSVDTAGLGIKHFFLSQSERTFVFPIEGGFRQAYIGTENDLSTVTWSDEPTALALENPQGIWVNHNNTRMFVGEMTNDITIPMRIKQFNKVGT